jgi:GNAT acetyltransferase-like protein
VNALQNTISRGSATESSPRVSVEVFDPLDHAAYDEMIAACPDSVPFHSRAWLSVIRDTYGHRPICFVAKSGRDVRALLPMVEVRSWITGRRGVTLPFADYCPPIASDALAYEIVLAEAVKYAQQRRWKYLEIRGGRKLMGEAQASVAFHAHILDLSDGTDKLFSRFDSRMRGAIRKAEKEGVRVEVSNTLEATQTYYALHCETRKKHGVPPQPFSFFQNLFRHFISKQSGIVVIAWHQKVPVAAAVFVHNGRQAVYKFSASNEAFLTLRGNNVVLW